MYDFTRSHDYDVLREASNSPDPNVRRQAQVAMERIKHEGYKVKSMREALLRAQRDGNVDEIKDINDFVLSHSDYQTYGRKKVWK